MKLIFRQPQLYRFLNFCNEEELEKTVLDCGAGGKMPPLSLFLQNGYKTYGIEISDKQIERAEAFSKEHKVNLNIDKGDMRKLPFENESFNYVYSYNSIFI
ncbi:class I SAM-dependent methyltransferase [Clostridium sp. DMHC 10]|uniref:class I SAM-dependent methyltransferase n=1 Tax=Clostridium sp. DMHC 10 TaxID=747377 RepID=UPI000A71BF27